MRAEAIVWACGPRNHHGGLNPGDCGALEAMAAAYQPRGRASDQADAAASVGLPLPGSPFPMPAYPYDVLPYAFVVLLAAASAWSLARPRGW